MGNLAWDQLPNETDVAYEHFQTYLQMEPKIRTYELTAAARNVSLQNIKMIGAKYKWQERARYYDVYMNDGILEEEVKKVFKRRSLIQIEELGDADKLRDAFNIMLEQLLQRPEDFKAVDFRNLMAAREDLAKFIRRAVEMPTGFRAMELDKDDDRGKEDEDIVFLLDEKKGTTAVDRLSK